MKQALKWGMLARNPCDAVDPPRVPRHEFVPLDETQSAAFLKAVEADPLKVLYIVAIAAGCRQGELLALRWDDVDLKAGTLSVRRSGRWKGDEFKTEEPKTAKGRRLVELPEVAVDALRTTKAAAMTEDRLQFGWLFCDAAGSPLERHNVFQAFRRLLKRAKLPVIRFHDLRHTSASLLLTAGVHPKIVQERLGHATISVTLDTYSHVMPGLQREAANSLNGLLTGNGCTLTVKSVPVAVGG